MDITDGLQEQAERLAMDLFRKKIVEKRMDFTVALMMVEDVMSLCLGAMCPGCRDDHWRMLEAHFAGIRSRAEDLYKSCYPDKPPI
jgi:hypothetical protein